MSQDQAIILALRVVLVAGVVSIVLFVADYTRLTRWGCWRNPIGRTLVWKDVLLACCLTPSLLSLFWHFSRLTSHIAAWVDIALFGLLAPVMLWRVAVFERIHRNKPPDPGEQDQGG